MTDDTDHVTRLDVMTAACHLGGMRTTIPTRITIDLERADERRGGWRARTRLGGRSRSRSAAPTTVVAAEQPEGAWTPALYEPGPCTCEGGLCDRDHENE
jgi:hypothetical protein